MTERKTAQELCNILSSGLLRVGGTRTRWLHRALGSAHGVYVITVVSLREEDLELLVTYHGTGGLEKIPFTRPLNEFMERFHPES